MPRIIERKYAEDQFLFMELAWDLARRSDCKEANYGAVIVKDSKIIGRGYNHLPFGYKCDDCFRRKIDLKKGVCSDLCLSIHAERDTIGNAKISFFDLEDSVMYIGKIKDGEIKPTRGRPHCTNCAQEILVNKIKEVKFYYNNHYDGFLVFNDSELFEKSHENLKLAYLEQLPLTTRFRQ